MVAEPTTPWRNRICGHGEEIPDQLLANPRNWRYVEVILERLEAEGWPAQPQAQSATKSNGKQPQADWLEKRYDRGKAAKVP